MAKQVPELHVPRVLTTSAGQATATIKGSGDTTHLVRLLSYLRGKALAIDVRKIILLCEGAGTHSTKGQVSHEGICV